MKRYSLSLDKILNIKRWQILQDSLSVVTKLAIITVDYKGNPITKHSGRRPFCKVVRESPNLESYCRKCDSRGGLESIRMGKPHIYLCHCSIVDMAIPIIVDDMYVGAIMAGQVRLSDSEHMPEQILVSPVQSLLQDTPFKELYNKLPEITYTEVETVAEMLNDLCQYIVGEALNHHLRMEINAQVMSPNHEGRNPFLGYSPDAINSIRKELGNALSSAYVESAHKKNARSYPILQPAFDYILNHRREYTSLKKAAELCHLSTSHFSRLFIKETGERFSSFQSRQKIEWAKKLLEDTDLSVTQIGEDLGFLEPGYFIKVFKKHEAITPNAYRRYFRKSADMF